MDIPVVILCGGKGTRVGQLSQKIPKPLLEIGGKPILWHVMKIYASQGYRRFILCLGYKGRQIESYFRKHNSERWQINFVDTGLDTPKTRRIAKIRNLISEENFFLAYGDDVADINLERLVKLHLKHNVIATITTVKMTSDFGIVEIGKNNRIARFKEKPRLDKWMNGGFMVMNRKIFKYLNAGELETDVFKKLVATNGLAAYKHSGQWKTMNTLKDNLELNALWREGKAFWKIW
ncbi:MAG: sugar phosphate nucleotidyltransferase [Candidatus Omnitrophota bacterium]|nr:sugar phosphate nucleotidyltransferase [Candidatus Omnitrophota bacterium]